MADNLSVDSMLDSSLVNGDCSDLFHEVEIKQFLCTDDDDEENR